MNLLKLGDINKFSFAEMTSNDTGKTSGTATSGVYIIAIGGFCFLLGCVDKMFISKSTDIMSQSTTLTAIGAALLGVRNVMNAKSSAASDSTATPAPEELTQINS